jgi:hypothetical protein
MYTGKTINLTDLFKPNTIDFEHTIPRSKSLDNSLANLSACLESISIGSTLGDLSLIIIVLIRATKSNKTNIPTAEINHKSTQYKFTESGEGTYSGPSLTNKISGQMVGSGSDGRLGVNRTEIEGGQDEPTTGGEFPLKWNNGTNKTVKKVKSAESKKRISALKKMQKVNMLSFDDFKKKDKE